MVTWPHDISHINNKTGMEHHTPAMTMTRLFIKQIAIIAIKQSFILVHNMSSVPEERHTCSTCHNLMCQPLQNKLA